MLTKEQEIVIRTVRARFVRIHGERAWVRFNRYIAQNLNEAEIMRLLSKDRKMVRYWMRVIKEIRKCNLVGAIMG